MPHSSTLADRLPPETAYCLKCKAVRPIVNAYDEHAKNGTRVLRGACETCGAALVRFTRKDQ